MVRVWLASPVMSRAWSVLRWCSRVPVLARLAGVVGPPAAGVVVVVLVDVVEFEVAGAADR